MKTSIKFHIAFVLLCPSITFAEPDLKLDKTALAALGKWIDVGSSNDGTYSLKAMSPSNNYAESLLKDKNGEYHYYMRFDSAKPTGKVAYQVLNGYFNCDKSEISFDQLVQYTKTGTVVHIFDKKGGKRHSIQVDPHSLAENALNIVCKFKFD